MQDKISELLPVLQRLYWAKPSSTPKHWGEAAAQFDDVISSGEYALAANYADNFSENPSVEQANPETIFSVEFTNDESPDLNWGGIPSATWRQFSAVAPTYAARGFGFL